MRQTMRSDRLRTPTPSEDWALAHGLGPRCCSRLAAWLSEPGTREEVKARDGGRVHPQGDRTQPRDAQHAGNPRNQQAQITVEQYTFRSRNQTTQKSPGVPSTNQQGKFRLGVKQENAKGT